MLSLVFLVLVVSTGTTAFIHGGRNTAPGEYPFFVGVMLNGKFCSGVLIPNDIVVTASHCVRGVSPEHIRVVPGDVFTSTPGPVARLPADYYPEGVSPKKIYESHMVDLALLTLPGPLKGTTPIKINYKDSKIKEEASLIGFNKTWHTDVKKFNVNGTSVLVDFS